MLNQINQKFIFSYSAIRRSDGVVCGEGWLCCGRSSLTSFFESVVLNYTYDPYYYDVKTTVKPLIEEEDND